MENTKEKIIEDWEKDFDEKWYLWDYSKRLGTYNTCGESVKSFVRTKKTEWEKKQTQETVEKIEKLKKGEHAEPVLITTILDFTKDFCKKNKLSATEEFDLNYKFGDIDRFCFNYALDQLKQTLNK